MDRIAAASEQSSSSSSPSPSAPPPSDARYQGEAIDIARANQLRYVNDGMPGIRRSRRGKGFAYHDAHGELIRDDDVVARLKSLAIPPAWEDVWISPHANGHIQATGRDARGRKQYRYHARWRSVRDDAKYLRMISFARALPTIRRVVEQDLKRPGLHRQKVLAAVVHLLQTTFMRVGNDEYAKQNQSFGLTTLRHRHVRVDGSDVLFRFRGKSGVQHDIKLHDPYVARIIRKMRELPGQELFQYVDDEGERHCIDSGDVNAYLREAAGEDFSAKDFRTWAGTVLATLALQAFERVDSQAQAKQNVVRAIENVARRLGNTPSICRKCYVHPAVIESYLDGSFAERLEERVQAELVEELQDLSPEEAAVLALLQQRLQEAEQQPARKPRRKPAARTATASVPRRKAARPAARA
ncbi:MULTISPECIES: DNA topoisomerase IB [Herbaspirillum]|uniref:DNA topoisomerase n=1 Tax=Herbaspirillum huttiense subsp. lycopersici TaxID=3074428 RepID=A0ABU2ETP7_9BURK|nr:MULTISPECIES: DNA topoisomerase IB [Herbaspirillum]MBP1316068.1 DNA topoisomerase-1 [Herbaspirillum sp. 1130]MDR9851552.1 DNA topoisomerase IB [Herbaspirillum huttiense SE1]